MKCVFKARAWEGKPYMFAGQEYTNSSVARAWCETHGVWADQHFLVNQDLPDERDETIARLRALLLEIIVEKGVNSDLIDRIDNELYPQEDRLPTDAP